MMAALDLPFVQITIPLLVGMYLPLMNQNKQFDGMNKRMDELAKRVDDNKNEVKAEIAELRRKIEAGFQRVEEKLDNHGERIAVLEGGRRR